jgi:hypothetical protein
MDTTVKPTLGETTAKLPPHGFYGQITKGEGPK